MSGSVDAVLRKGGKIQIKIKASSRERFLSILNKLKDNMPVMIYDRSSKCYSTSIFYLDDLESICDELSIDLYCSGKLITYHFRVMKKIARIKRLSKKKNQTFKSKYWSTKKDRQPYKYQIEDINKYMLFASPYFGGHGIGSEMGVGKTIEAIAVICKMFERGSERAFILVPNRLKYQWKEEIEFFTKFKDKDISVVDASNFTCLLNKIDKPNMANKICKECERHSVCREERANSSVLRERQIKSGRIVICNYSLIIREEKQLKKQKFDIIIMDEAAGKSGVKNHGTSTSKAMFRIRKVLYNAVVFPMSGTFIENKLEEIYNPISLINQNVFGEYFNFRNNYLIVDYFNKVCGYKNEKPLRKILDTWITRREIEEVWKDRPPLTESNRICIMEKEQRDFYVDARDGALKELRDLDKQDKINTASIGALINYLIQICGSTETMDPDKKHSCKLDYLKDLIVEEIGNKKKVLLFSFFAKKLVPLITRELKDMKVGKVSTIVGGMKDRDVEKIKKSFTKGDCRFLVCSDTMSYGANLQSAECVVNFDLPWNPAILDQRIRRVYRRGQTKAVNVYNLVTENTVEDRILEIIGSKRQLFSKFLGKKDIKKDRGMLSKLLKVLKGS